MLVFSAIFTVNKQINISTFQPVFRPSSCGYTAHSPTVSLSVAYRHCFLIYLWFDPRLFVDLPLSSVFVLLLLLTDFASVNIYLFFGSV